MNLLITFLLAVGCFLASCYFTKKFISYALKSRLLDIPNERSSHSMPTPRGGGVGFVLASTLSFIGAYFLGLIQYELALPLFISGVGIAVVGFVDDRKPLSAKFRFSMQLLLCILSYLLVGGPERVVLLGLDINSKAVLAIIFVVGMVWMANLYNFMDGIDGVAAVQAIVACACFAILMLLDQRYEQMIFPFLIAAAVTGFLVFNFPPAKIFMGDAGSGFLGGCFGVFILQAATFSSEYLCYWLVLLSLFLTDSTLTLLRRLFRRKKVYEAHRSHAYQYASRACGSHKVVTIFVGLATLFWLFPTALAVERHWINGSVALMIAYVPALGLCYYFKAGAAEIQTV